MKGILAITLLVGAGPLAWSLVACEGEPPLLPTEVPSNAMGAAPGPAAADDSASAAAVAPTPPPTTPACPPPPCAPAASAASGAASDSAAALASTPPAASASVGTPPEAPAEEVERGNIAGVVTTKPASLQGQAIVYLEDNPEPNAHLQTITIDNKMMNFIPYVAVAAAGARVVFANEDPFPHNVFSPDNEKFNMGTIPQNGAHSRVFKAPGVYSLLCNLHPGMLGYLLVTPSTHYARTDAKGRFTMKHVPVGTYRLSAWAPRLPPVTQSVTVTEGDVTLNFDLHR